MATRKHKIDQTDLVNIMYSKYHKEEEEKKNDDADMDDGNSSHNGDGDSNEGMLQFYITGTANTEERVTYRDQSTGPRSHTGTGHSIFGVATGRDDS